MVPAPKIRSIFLLNLSTIYTQTMLNKTAKIMLMSAYWERIDNKVVRAPAPAISGKTTGIKVASLGESGELLKISISNIISIAMTKMMSEPAIANDEISTWNKRKNASPT